MKYSYNYYISFVLSGIPTHMPSGGEKVVYELSSRFAESGKKVAFIVIRNSKKFLYRVKNDSTLLNSLSIRDRIYSVLYHLIFFKMGIFWLLRKKNKVPYDFSILSDVDIIFCDSSEDLNVVTDNLIATSWDTADFADEYIKEHPHTRGYYFIQNSEDSESISGSLTKFAKETYELKTLKKITINSILYNRFREDDPLRINIGIDLNLYSSSDEKEKIIIFPLRKGEYKGPENALESVAMVEDRLPEWKFIAFGNYESQIPDSIKFYSRPNDKFLRDLYRKSSIFFLPSKSEGFPLTVLEAMASGCAVVSTECGGVNEYIENGKNGLLVPVNDPVALSDAIFNLASDSRIISKFSKMGSQTVQRYSFDNTFQTFKELFEQPE